MKKPNADDLHACRDAAGGRQLTFLAQVRGPGSGEPGHSDSLPNEAVAAPIRWMEEGSGPVHQDSRHIVIAGGGHAGGSAAAMLRQLNWQGAITVIGEEPIPPYQRPRLSKAWLKGEATAESLALRPATFYPEATIDLLLGTRVTAIDRAAKTVALSNERTLSYDFLILATWRAGATAAAAGYGFAGRAGASIRGRCGSAEGRTAAGRQAGGDRRRLYRTGSRRVGPSAGR